MGRAACALAQHVALVEGALSLDEVLKLAPGLAMLCRPRSNLRRLGFMTPCHFSFLRIRFAGSPNQSFEALEKALSSE